MEDDLKSVQLDGLVDTQEKKEEIENILKKFKEIKSVTGNLTIRPPRYNSNPFAVTKVRRERRGSKGHQVGSIGDPSSRI